jgi:hypothetical protein
MRRKTAAGVFCSRITMMADVEQSLSVTHRAGHRPD